RLLDLALQAALGGQEQVLDQLLGEGRAALNGPAGAPVDPGGADQALVVERAVLVEARVLGRQEGLYDMVGQLGEGDAVAESRVSLGDQLAAPVEEADARRPLGLVELLLVRDVRQ